MPYARPWTSVNVERRVREAGGWITALGPVDEGDVPARGWHTREEPSDAEERAVERGK